jgi:hypothetical protein
MELGNAPGNAAQETCDSRMGAKVNFSQLFSSSATVLAIPEALTARSFLTLM